MILAVYWLRLLGEADQAFHRFSLLFLVSGSFFLLLCVSCSPSSHFHVPPSELFFLGYICCILVMLSSVVIICNMLFMLLVCSVLFLTGVSVIFVLCSSVCSIVSLSVCCMLFVSFL